MLLSDVGADVLGGCADENGSLLRELNVLGNYDGALLLPGACQ
jgi:hypothetical protein